MNVCYRCIPKSFLYLLAVFAISFQGCATTSSKSFFYENSGNYIALARHPDFTDEFVKNLANEYGAYVSHVPYHGPIANATEDFLSKAIAPSAYTREVVDVIETMMRSPQIWVVIVIPENIEFMTTVLKLVKEPRPSNLLLLLVGDMTPEFEKETKRLNLIRAPIPAAS